MDLDAARLHLLKLIAEQDTDLTSVSRAIEKNHAYLQQYIQRGTPRVLPEEVREQLAARLGGSPDDFRRGPQESAKPERTPTLGRSLTIDELDIRAGNASGGQIQDMEDRDNGDRVIAKWQIPTNVVRAYTQAPEAAIKIIVCVGESNEPVLMPGQRVMVDTNDRIPTPPGFFAIWDGFGELIKRLEMVPYSEPARVKVRSANPAYEPYEVPLEGLVINGRVVGKWTWT